MGAHMGQSNHRTSHHHQDSRATFPSVPAGKQVTITQCIPLSATVPTIHTYIYSIVEAGKEKTGVILWCKKWTPWRQTVKRNKIIYFSEKEDWAHNPVAGVWKAIQSLISGWSRKVKTINCTREYLVAIQLAIILHLHSHNSTREHEGSTHHVIRAIKFIARVNLNSAHDRFPITGLFN